MKFTKDFLQDMGGKTMHEAIVGHDRWSVRYARIFEHEGKFYKTSYRVGATEQQDESPYEHEADEIECQEVHQVEKLVKAWEPVVAV